MRRLLLALSLAIVAILIAWFVVNARRSQAIAPSAPVVEKQTDAPLEGSGAGGPITPTRSTAETAASVPTAHVDAAHTPDCFVFGRVIDTNGSPIEGCDLLLSAIGHWSDDVEPPLVEFFGRNRPMFTTKSGRDGRFRFEVPVPTAETIRLNVRPDDFHALVWRDFGTVRDQVTALPARGDNDVGDLVVPTTGAIRGHITDPDGKPIAATTFSFSDAAHYAKATTDKDGVFVVGNIKTGTWTIGVSATGWVSAEHKQVLVRPGVMTDDVDYRLEHASTISGIVVDKNGTPLADVEIEARVDLDSGSAYAHSDEHGAFSLSLNSAKPQQLMVRRQVRFESWSGSSEAGRQDVRIALDTIPLTTFRIVDATSAAPIERFGIHVETKQPSEESTWSDPWPRPPQIESHPGGEVVLPALPVRSTVDIQADGFAAKQLQVAWDQPDHMVQTIVLAREGSIRARVLFAGEAVVAAKITLEAEHLRNGQPSDVANGSTDVDEFAGRRRFQLTDKDGVFSFTRLAAGTYRLTVDTPLAARNSRRAIHVDAGAPRDLGAIVLDPGATLRAHLLLPAGERPELSAYIGGYPDARPGELQSDGTFVFRGLEAGTHELSIRQQPPWVPEPVRQKVTLSAGETREIDIDLVPHVPINVTVHVTQNGESVGWVHVRAQVMANGFPTKTLDVGTTSDEGTATGKCPGDCNVRFVARTAKGVLLGQSAAVVHLPASGACEEQLALSTSGLSLQLPPALSVPANATIKVTLTPSSAAGRDPIQLDAATKGSVFAEPLCVEWVATTVDFGEIAAGEYDAAVAIARFEPDAAGRPNNWTKTDFVHPFKTKLVLEPGKSATITVP